MITTIAGHRLLYLMAAGAEYGACLKRLITPVMIGVGPVEAAVNAATAIARHTPDLVVSLGSCGSAKLAQGAVYQVSHVSYRDMDASPLGFEKGRTPFLDLPAEIELPLRVEGVAAARLSTGGNIVSGAAYAAIDADMVDMETYAVLRACMQTRDGAGVPLIGLRGVSDGKAELRRFEDWSAYLTQVDEALAQALALLHAQVESGHIRL